MIGRLPDPRRLPTSRYYAASVDGLWTGIDYWLLLGLLSVGVGVSMLSSSMLMRLLGPRIDLVLSGDALEDPTNSDLSPDSRTLRITVHNVGRREIEHRHSWQVNLTYRGAPFVSYATRGSDRAWAVSQRLTDDYSQIIVGLLRLRPRHFCEIVAEMDAAVDDCRAEFSNHNRSYVRALRARREDGSQVAAQTDWKATQGMSGLRRLDFYGSVSSIAGLALTVYTLVR